MATLVVYDSEDMLDSVKAVMTAGLNTKISEIEALKITQGKGLTPTLAQISSDAYHEQTWSNKVLQKNPAIFYGIEDVSGINGGQANGIKYKVFCEVILVDNGMTNDVHKRLARYSRALKEIFESAYAEGISGNRITIDVVRPISIMASLDSDDEIKIGGVSLTITLV